MAAKRELIAPNGDKRYVRRDARGRIRESDDQGRSLSQDQRRAATTKAKPGLGDRGDRNPATGGSNSSKTRNATMKKATAKKATAKKSTTKKSTAKKSTAKKSGVTKSATKKAVPRKATAKSAPARAPNAIQLLKDDHVKVRGLLGELEKTTARGAKTRTELLAKIAREIEVHTKIEEEIFYPAFRAAGQRNDDDKQYFEALEEHRAAGDLVLPDLLATDPASECFGGRAKVLKEMIEHHAGEEEKEMFPRARQLLSADELKVLGERMAARKQALLAAPSEPKSAAIKLVEAVAGVFSGEGDGAASSRTRSDGSENRAQR